MINDGEVSECTCIKHHCYGSKYLKNAVPVEKFTKPGSSIIFKTCLDCRNYGAKNKKIRSEKLNKLIIETTNLETDILCCTSSFHTNSVSSYKRNEVPVELFRETPSDVNSKIFKTCRDCRNCDKQYNKIRSEKLNKLVIETNKSGSDILCCTSSLHPNSDSIYKQNEVPVELFRKEPGNTKSDLFKMCKNCRDQYMKYAKIRVEKLNKLISETNKSESGILCCTNLLHSTSDSIYKQNEVPIELFRKEPGNTKSELFKMCRNCRNIISANQKINISNKVSTAIQKDMFFCKTCSKEKLSSNKAINLNGSESAVCVDCKPLLKEKSKQFKIKYHNFKIEIIEKNECSCLICEKIYLRDHKNSQAIEIETFMIDNIRHIKHNNKNYTCKDFINDYKHDLEILILQFDHLSENEQRERGLLLPEDKFIPKKNSVSQINNESAMRLEALKCQLICARCHIITTIEREKGYIKCGVFKDKIEYTNKIKENGCENCKYKNNHLPRFFHFDHIDPNNKITEVGTMVQNYDFTLKDVISEVNKCRILCQHCHLIHTHNQFNNGVLLDKIHKNHKNTK
jgi:hypothetical protein